MTVLVLVPGKLYRVRGAYGISLYPMIGGGDGGVGRRRYFKTGSLLMFVDGRVDLNPLEFVFLTADGETLYAVFYGSPAAYFDKAEKSCQTN